MDKETKDMFNAILEEMGRVETRICNKFEGRFDRIESTLEQMQHEINANKLEKESLELLSKRTDQLEERVDKLETRTA